MHFRGHRRRVVVMRQIMRAASILVVTMVMRVSYSASAVPLAPHPDEITLIALLTNPLSYDGKRVRVEGFAVFEYETEALFLSRDDAIYHIQVNSIPLSTGKSLKELSELNGHYVFVSGTFKATKDEMRGYLHSIDILKPLAPVRQFR